VPDWDELSSRTKSRAASIHARDRRKGEKGTRRARRERKREREEGAAAGK